MPLPTLHTSANPVIEVDINGLPIDSPATTTGRYVQGNVASGALDSGNPVKVGGEFNATLPTFTNGMRGDLQLNNRGGLLVALRDESGNTVVVNRSTDVNGSASGLAVWSQGMVFNGTTWDRARGNTLGAMVQGAVASGASDSGNPLKVGGVYTAGEPAYAASASRLDLRQSSIGDLRVATVHSTPATDGVAVGLAMRSDATFAGIATGGLLFNGTTWDRQRGDASGTWTHAPTNSVSTALSGTIATSGGTAAIAFVSTARQEVINSSTSTIWASWATPTVNGAGSFPVNAGGSFSSDRTAGTLTLLSTVATQPFTVNRYS